LANTLDGTIFWGVHLSKLSISWVVFIVDLNKIAVFLLLEVLLEVLLPDFCRGATSILGSTIATLALEAALA
jgi:hypothetical protein